jgi:hypothetical protein
VTLDLSAGDDYGLCQTWAAVLAEQGFAGVAGHIRHDSSATARNLAVFGKSGPAQRVVGWQTTSDDVLGNRDLVAALRHIGVTVLDRPYDVDVVE